MNRLLFLRKTKNFTSIAFFLLSFFYGGVSWGQTTTVFSDDFSATTSATYTTSGAIGASAWTVLSGGTAGQDFGARRNTSPAQLELTNDATVAANVNGWVLASTATGSFISPYNTTLSSNTGAVITWSFNMRQIRTDPAGLASGSYGVGYVLAGTSTTTSTVGTGWAVVLGQSGATDAIRLVKYTAGLAASTNVITSNTAGLTDFGTEYLSVQVKYTQATNTWELLLRNDGASAFADPLTGTLASQGTAVDATNTATVLGLMGAYWSGSTAATQTSFFDNVSVKVTTVPSGNTLAPYGTQLSGNIIKGTNDKPLAGFSLTPATTTDFTGVTVTGGTATSTDITNVRIFKDNNGNGLIDGADASVSGAGIAFDPSMIFTITGETGLSALTNYLIVGDVAFAATASSMQVSISSGNYTTSAGSNNGSMASVNRSLVSPPGTSTVSAGAGTEPASVSSLINTQGASVLNFDIAIHDDGGTDATDVVDTKISQLAFSQGTGNDVADWTLAIAGAELSDGTNTQTGTVSATAITFAGINITTLGLISDNATKTYTLKVWLNADLTTLKTTIDGANLVFAIQNSGVTADNTGSQLASGQDQNSGAANNAVDVTASALAYVQNTSNVATGAAMTPSVTVQAVDANGNRDLGFTEQVRITSTGTLSGTPIDATASLGLATFSTLTHTSAATARTLNAERTNTLDWDITSAAFDVLATTINYTTLGSTLTQSFDGLSNTASVTWSNGTTPLQGWFAVAPLSPFISPTTLTGPQNGSSTTAALGNFGASGNANRSLGWVYANGVGAAATLASIGVGITNTSGTTITEYTLSYLGRQWRTNTTTPGTLVVEYKIGGTFDNNNTGWTATPASLTFTGPNTTGATNIDGYAVGNTASLSATVSSITWPDGETIWIRWRDTNDPNTDAQLAIDDVNFSTPQIPNTVLDPYTPQLSANVIRGNNDVPLAGFTVTPTAALNFTGVTFFGSIATLTDVTNVRIFKDNNGNGLIDGADASVSGAGIAFAASMPFSFTEALAANTASAYLIVGDIEFNGTSPDVTVDISSAADFSTSIGTKASTMQDVTRIFASPVGTSTITAGPGTEPASISSLLNTQGAAVLNFDFTITDDGATPSTDAEPTDISSTTITQGTGNDVADWTQVIAGAEITDGINTAPATVNAGNLAFDFSSFPPDGAISLSDDEIRTFTVKVWLKSDLGSLKTTIDGSNLVFKISSDGISYAGSGFLSGQEQNSGATNNAIDVAATLLAFVQDATPTGANQAMTPAVTVSANDANGNRDLNFTEQVRITSTGALSGTPVDATATSGLATFSTLTHTTGGTGLTLNAERTNTLDWDITSASFDITIVTSATDFFRSNVVTTGNWNVASNWQSSPDGNDPWITSSMIPNSSANTITIRNGNNISITAPVTVDQVVIESGGTLTQTSAFTVANNVSSDDIIVQNGGTMVYSLAATPPTYSSSTIRINQGGVLSVKASGLTALGAGVNASTHIYDNGSILEYGITSTPSSSNVVFFPNVDANTVPVMRFAASVTSWGAGNPTTINGKLEVASGFSVTFGGAAVKNIRNGIRGAGNVSQGAAGQIIIAGAVAELGGTGTLTLGAAGLAIGAASTTTLSSNKTIAGTGTTTISGVLDLNGFTLTSVAIAGAGTISGSATSSLVINAASTLRFTTGAQTLKNLTINTGTTTLATLLSITGGASANNAGVVTVAPGATLAAGNNLTLRSNEFGTASIGTGSAGGNYITGNVTVERYIPNNGFRSWRLLSVPTTNGQSIRQAWQEGDLNPLPKQNNVAGYGTQITGVFTTQAAATAAGFDSTSISGSMLTWNGTGWSNVTSTNQPINNFQSYFLYVRGDRSQTVTGSVSNSSATTLRTTGTLYTGDQSVNVGASSFALIPNLHASAINFTGLTRTGGVNNLFYIWDSKKLNGSSLGAYQTFSATNSFNCLISGGSYTLGQPNTKIESGQSFFVSSGASGTIVLNESAKISGGANLGLRPVTPANQLVKIDSRLYSGTEAVDANVVVFNNAYPYAVADEDAVKLANPQENFAIIQSSKKLAIEGRPVINESDTIFFSTWNLKQQQYRLEFVPNKMAASGLIATFEDKYLHTSTLVSLDEATSVTFTVDANKASSAHDRFRIVFGKPGLIEDTKAGFTVFPNPVAGKTVNLQFKKQIAGKYSIRLTNTTGQVVLTKVIGYAGGNGTQVINLPANTARGSYQLEVIAPDNTKTIQKLVIN